MDSHQHFYAISKKQHPNWTHDEHSQWAQECADTHPDHAPQKEKPDAFGDRVVREIEELGGRLEGIRSRLAAEEAQPPSTLGRIATSAENIRPILVGIFATTLVIVAILLGILLILASPAKAEPAPKPYINVNAIRAAVDAAMTPVVDTPIIKVSNGGSVLATIPAGVVIFDCGTNMACSWTAATHTFGMSASSTASTAFSALTASANSNLGTFSASGNTWDFSASTLFKLRVGAGATTSANGDVAYDSTAALWHIWQGAANRSLIASTNLGTSGQPCLSNADGSCTFADPIVSQATASNLNAQVVGNAASAAADSGNPVKIGGTFNTTQPTVTTGQRVDAQMTARGAQIVGTGADAFHVTVDSVPTTAVTGTFWQATQPVSLASLPAVAGNKSSNGGTPGSNNLGVLPAVANAASPTLTEGNQAGLSVDLAGNLRVSNAATDTAGTTTALGALNAAAAVSLTGQQTASIFIASGTLSGTLVPEFSTDGGTTWTQGLFYNPNSNAIIASAVLTNPNSATQLTILAPGGSSGARVRVSAYTSGTANATARASMTTNARSMATLYDASGTERGTGGNPMNVAFPSAQAVTLTSTSANQGTAASLPGAWPVKVTDGTNTMPTGDSSARPLHVNCDAGCTAGGSFSDSTAFTFGSSAIGLMGAVVDDTATNTVAENSAGAPRMNTNRILYFNPRNNSGTEIGTAANPFRVDPTGTTTQPVSWSGQSVTVTQGTGANLHVVCDSGCSGSGGTSSNFGAAFPTAGTAIGAKNGTNMVNLTADASNNLNVNCASGCAGGSSTPADTFSNPTTAGLQMTFPTVWNGTSWDRLYGDKTNGAFVQIKNTPNVNIQSNAAINLAQVGGASVALGQTTMSASIPVAIASNQGAVPASQSGTWTVQPGNTANTTPWLTTQTPGTTGGLSISRTLSAASTNSTNAKGSAGQVYGWYIVNTSAALKYVKLYNKATAPTCGTDTPVITLAIPAASATGIAGAGSNVDFSGGIAFSTGIGYCITGAVADNDTTAVASNDVILNLFYK